VDVATIDAARRGDRRAQAQLLTALQDVWYRFCLSQLRDADLAADATQETALRFLKQLSGFRGDSQLQTWSLGIALNVAREIRRKQRGDTSTVDPDDAQFAQLAPERSSGDLKVEDQEQQSQMKSFLQTLPDRQREAIVLRFFEELSVEQTAAAMNCAVGTVKATVHQALRALRQKMSQSI
jgi:RNA polymerase sigma-70 factor (ECF subfamily)